MLVEDDAVLLVEARVRRHGHNHVDAIGHVHGPGVMGAPRIDDGPLRVMQDVRGCVEALVEVGGIEADGLLGLCGMEDVAGRLVVVREWNVLCDHGQQGGRVDLGVCVEGTDAGGAIKGQQLRVDLLDV